MNIIFYSTAATSEKKLPVIVFIHGESFEWNSGNPYDGTVLASYAELVVVTLNYRLGILGLYISFYLSFFFFLLLRLFKWSFYHKKVYFFFLGKQILDNLMFDLLLKAFKSF